MINKYAIISMDIEDWYHLDYFNGKSIDKTKSMLDGFENYLELLDKYKIKTTFFVLSEIAKTVERELLLAVKFGHEIACHGKTHTRPLKMDVNKFQDEITEAKAMLENIIGKEVVGYRAPCCSLDNERYEIVKSVGFQYSSSYMNVPWHTLYGNLNFAEYSQPMKGIYEKDGFYEFSLGIIKYMGINISVSGGGWIRLFPWLCFMKPMINKFLSDAEIYTLYIHPFEMSNNKMPKVPETSFITNLRARCGLGNVDSKVNTLIQMLNTNNFMFTTFFNIVNTLNSGKIN